jgi:hypothetical protein
MRLASARHVLFGVAAALAVAAGGTLAPRHAVAQPQPTLVLSPSSGPCDATVEVKGSGFPVSSGPAETLRLYLIQPGTADISMDILNPAFVQPDGTFRQWASLHTSGCEAAAMDSRAGQPTGHLLMAASSSLEHSGVPRGERVPNIIASVRYQYTTTTPYVPTETLQVSPASGPCDASVGVMGQGFAPNTGIRLDMGVPKGDGTMGNLASVTTDANGGFAATVDLGSLGCQAAALDGHYSGQLWIVANLQERPVEPGQGMPPILTRAPYGYTTTAVSPAPAAQPQSTLVLSPSSGPCDATVHVTGQDFPPNTTIELDVGQIGGQAPEGRLDLVLTDADGHLSFSTVLGFLACGIAGVTKDRTGGDQLWILAYVLGPETSAGPPARISARAPYTFTTTESTLPIAVLTLSPSSGPCDATVEATGALFEPGSDVTVQVARPYSEGYMGTLGQVRADAHGGFVTTLTLGALGCEAAALRARGNRPGEPNEFSVCGDAYHASRCATYAYTTTAVSPEARALPSTGTGPGGRPMSRVWFPLAAVLAGLGLTLVVASLHQRRQRS